jgi:hypothetical protein
MPFQLSDTNLLAKTITNCKPTTQLNETHNIIKCVKLPIHLSKLHM